MIYYHGGNKKFDCFDFAFNRSGNGNNRDGFGHYFTKDEIEAVRYANSEKNISNLIIDGRKIQCNFLELNDNSIKTNFSNEIKIRYKYVFDTCESSIEQTNFIKSLFEDDDNFDKIDSEQFPLEPIYRGRMSRYSHHVKYPHKKHEIIKRKVLDAKTLSTFYEVQNVGFVYKVDIDETNLMDTKIDLSKQIKHIIQQRLYAEGFGKIKLKSNTYWSLNDELKEIEKISKKDDKDKFISFLLFRCGVTGIKNGEHAIVFDRKIIKILDVKQYFQ